MSAKELLNDPSKLDQVAKQAFKTMDLDGNGLIDLKELKNALKDLDADEVEEILKAMDNDCSGKITYSEFLSNFQKILEQMY